MSKIPRRRAGPSSESPGVPTQPRPTSERSGTDAERLTAHRGFATKGEQLVPLAAFRHESAAQGTVLSAVERRAATAHFLAPRADGVAVEGPFSKVVAFGGIYNNHFALAALLEEAAVWGADAVYCLGDFGGFGPNPEKVRPLLAAGDIRPIAGNYEQSLAAGSEDCNCGYADPRDNHFAEVSYQYTARHTSAAFRRDMAALPPRRRFLLGEGSETKEVLVVHGSPRRVNEFLFDSTTSDDYLEVLLTQESCSAMLCTHTGLPWLRPLASGRIAANVGVIGRPANNGRTEVWYARLSFNGPELQVEHVPLRYDHQKLAAEMRQEELPPEFVETIETGWWTTCLEILPAKERRSSRH